MDKVRIEYELKCSQEFYIRNLVCLFPQNIRKVRSHLSLHVLDHFSNVVGNCSIGLCRYIVESVGMVVKRPGAVLHYSLYNDKFWFNQLSFLNCSFLTQLFVENVWCPTKKRKVVGPWS